MVTRQEEMGDRPGTFAAGTVSAAIDEENTTQTVTETISPSLPSSIDRVFLTPERAPNDSQVIEWYQASAFSASSFVLVQRVGASAAASGTSMAWSYRAEADETV